MFVFQNDMLEWLHLLGLGQYYETLTQQGYEDIDYVTDITWEDLEEIGINKLGNQSNARNILHNNYIYIFFFFFFFLIEQRLKIIL